MDKPQEIHIYEPESQLHHPLRLLRSILTGFSDGRFLAWRLFIRNISAMYRQSFLGLAWAFIPPVMGTLFWVFLRGQNVFSVDDTPIPYIVFVFTGTILWQIFLDALNTPLKVIQQAKSMLVKINFPREAILLSGFYEIVFNLLIKLLLLIFVFMFTGMHFHVSAFAGLIGILTIVFLGFTFSLILAPVSLLYGDVQKGISIITQFLFFLTPIIYPMPKGGMIAAVARLNPVATILDESRSWLVTGYDGVSSDFVLIFCLSLLGMVCGLILFRLSLPHLIERIGS